MISTFLYEHARLAPAVFLMLLAGCVLLGTVLLRTGERGRRVLGGLTLLAVLAVIPLTLLPGGLRRSDVFCTVQFAWPAWGAVETLANIALLLSAVFFLTLLVRRPVLIVLVASACSAGIELTQALLPALGRACDTTDWEMNTIGAVVGALLAVFTLALNRRKTSL